MSDTRFESNARFEQDLRTVLRDMAPADAPKALRDALAAVPRTRPMTRRGTSPIGSGAGPRSRFAMVMGLAAALVLAMAGLAVLLAGGFGGRIAAPSASPTPSATSQGVIATAAPSESPSSFPSSGAATPSPRTTASPVRSPATPGTLAVASAPGVPDNLDSVTRWTGGYVGAAQETNTGKGLYYSPDGRTWSRVLTTQYLDGIAPCGNRAVALWHTIDGPTISTSVSWTADGTTWQTDALAPDPNVPVILLAGGSVGAIAAADDGTILTTADCATWTSSKVSKPVGLHITGVGVLGSRFIAVGYSGPDGSRTAMAWWSDNGTTWHAASVKAPSGQGFASNPSVGSGGAIALVSSNMTPGISSHLATTDGTAWTKSPSPLGIVANAEGAGSDSGLLVSDGTHILLFGSPGANLSGSMQFWIGDGSGSWSRLRFTGSAADLRTIVSGGSYPLLLEDGLIVGSGSSALIATGPLP